MIDEMPEIDYVGKEELKRSSVYQIMHQLVDHTNKLIQESNLSAARKCFNIVNQLYTRGNARVKCAIENVYVYALDRMFLSCKCDKNEILQLVPQRLYSIYINQIVSSNI